MDLRRFFSRFWPVIVGISIFVYFAYHGFSGERGISKYWTLQHQLDEKEFDFIQLQAQRQALEEKVHRLHPKSIDLDFLEEQAMRGLNFFHESHTVVIDNHASTLHHPQVEQGSKKSF
jgi:cell division protein FtsB